jgi:DNA mismatch repair protein MutL
VRDTIREVLMTSRPAPTISVRTTGQAAAELPYSDFSRQIENGSFESVPAFALHAAGPGDVPRAEDLPVFRMKSPPAPPASFDFGGSGTAVNTFAERQAPPAEGPTTFRLPVPDTHVSLPSEASADIPATMHSLPELRPLGQIHNSFIIAAAKDGLWIIDQHVAHERILFEKVLKQRAGGRVEQQQLLMPMVLQLSAPQQVLYARIADELNMTGFETEPFGNRTIAVKGAPADVSPADIERIVFEILEIADQELRTISVDDLRRGIAASIACHAAIKVNMRLEPPKMEWLLSALAATDYPMSCPHGRPVALRYSTREILKSFHRI